MQEFLEKWDADYRAALKTILLFDPIQTAKWSQDQQQLFIKLFYHQRGHFDDVLWLMGNFAPDAESKHVILGNIQEEFGGKAPSHEQLYLDFAKSHGVDLTYELLEERWYLPFLHEFNQGLLRWLREQDWDRRIIAFAAIERLDNLDYPALKEVAVSFGTAQRFLVFFNVHMHVDHYSPLEKLRFEEIWQENQNAMLVGFNFIAEYYLAIWRRISDYVFLHAVSPEIIQAT
jgi:pyrroloquinoline quinone (PQQ) biosynthesis protein C